MKHQSRQRNTNRAPAKKRTRVYSSPLRLEQAALTRQRIIQAYGEEIMSGGDRDLTVQQIATRAGVSVPTLYRNFQSLDALGEAYWATIEPRFGSLEGIKTADDLPAYTERLFAQLEGDPTLAAMLWTRAGRRLRERTVGRRNEAFLRAIAPLTKRMPPRQAYMVAAMCKVISSGHVWDLLNRDWGLDGAEAGHAAGWALRTLIEAIRKQPNPLAASQPQKG